MEWGGGGAALTAEEFGKANGGVAAVEGLVLWVGAHNGYSVVGEMTEVRTPKPETLVPKARYRCRETSFKRNSLPLGPYGRPMPRALRCS